MTQFKAAMAKLQVLGQKNLIDCSDVVPVPATFAGPITYPATFSKKDVQVAVSAIVSHRFFHILTKHFTQCQQSAFPSLATVAGPAPTLSPVPGS